MKLKKMAMRDLTMVNFLNSEKLDQSFDNLSSLMDERDEAYRNFKNIGIPSKRNERWKYTDLKNNIRGIDFPIPGNDDARRSIDLYCSLLKETILNAKKDAPKNPILDKETEELKIKTSQPKKSEEPLLNTKLN